LLMDRDEMSNLYRGPSIDATYQVSVHFAKRFQSRRFFRNRPISIKNCLWRPCLLRIEPKWTIFIEDLPYMRWFLRKSSPLKPRIHSQLLFLVGHFLKIFSKTTSPNEPKLDKKNLVGLTLNVAQIHICIMVVCFVSTDSFITHTCQFNN
jgi:hypothetical protein